MLQLNDIVWAKYDDLFWPGVIIRPKSGNLRVWRFNGSIYVKYLHKTTNNGHKTMAWVKEKDVVPFEILPGRLEVQDLSLRKAYNRSLNRAKLSGFVPQFARNQVVQAHKSRTTPAAPVPVVPEIVVKKEESLITGTFGIFNRVKNAVLFSVKKEVKDEKPAPSPLTTLLSTPKSLKRKRKDDKENDIADVTPRTSAKVRRIFGKNLYLKPDEITEEMLASLPKRVKDKKRPVTDEDKTRSTSCHQCRQKTMDMKTMCRAPGREGHGTGNLCSICLRNIYGQDIKVVLKDPDWTCPSCHGECVCSLCMKKKGLAPNGALSQEAKSRGFNSVSDYIASGKGALQKMVETII